MATAMKDPFQKDPLEIRYIKLGLAGRWAADALRDGTLPFGYRQIAHVVCAQGQWDSVLTALRRANSTESSAQDSLREVRDFYSLGTDCLWISFADQKLWWGFAEAGIEAFPDASNDQPSRLRRMMDGWHCTDVAGAVIRIDTLSTRLTKVNSYQRTICRVQERDYLLRRLRAIENPAAKRAKSARTELVLAANSLIQELHWKDFEIFADLLLSRTGWQRMGEVGGIQAETDIIARQPATGETAFVQVKSRATQSVLNASVEQFRRSGYQRMFFICHSPKGEIALAGEPQVHLWTGTRLAELAFECGLDSWLVQKAG